MPKPATTKTIPAKKTAKKMERLFIFTNEFISLKSAAKEILFVY
jgi:hypothetical protein